MNHYYFYIDDEDFGPIFLKVCSYAPWSLKLCLKGHEWAKRQMEKQGVAFQTLDNGFLSRADPQKLQQTCDLLGPEQIDRPNAGASSLKRCCVTISTWAGPTACN